MINVVFAIDNNLREHVLNVVNSIDANTKSKVRYFFLLAPGFDAGYIAKYKSRLFNVYENVDIPEIDNFHRSIVKSKAMFNRWAIADTLPMIDRAIYLDADILLNADIQELWDTDLGDKIVGAVPCEFGQTVRDTIRYQGLVSDVDAFTNYDCDIDLQNYLSGQLVINLKKWRENNITTKLICFQKENKTADMITLNVVCQKHIMPLDNLWSAPANFLNEGLKSNPPVKQNDFSKAKLFHFHGKRKPWDKGYFNKKLKSMWERYSG